MRKSRRGRSYGWLRDRIRGFWLESAAKGNEVEAKRLILEIGMKTIFLIILKGV